MAAKVAALVTLALGALGALYAFTRATDTHAELVAEQAAANGAGA